MSNLDNGGQAFPRQPWEYDGHNNVLQYQENGMTLRDYFAAKAMQALIGRGGVFEGTQVIAYEIADLMLKARE